MHLQLNRVNIKIRLLNHNIGVNNRHVGLLDRLVIITEHMKGVLGTLRYLLLNRLLIHTGNIIRSHNRIKNRMGLIMHTRRVKNNTDNITVLMHLGATIRLLIRHLKGFNPNNMIGTKQTNTTINRNRQDHSYEDRDNSSRNRRGCGHDRSSRLPRTNIFGKPGDDLNTAGRTCPSLSTQLDGRGPAARCGRGLF